MQEQHKSELATVLALFAWESLKMEEQASAENLRYYNEMTEEAEQTGYGTTPVGCRGGVGMLRGGGVSLT